jgi:hypothetical protein
MVYRLHRVWKFRTTGGTACHFIRQARSVYVSGLRWEPTTRPSIAPEKVRHAPCDDPILSPEKSGPKTGISAPHLPKEFFRNSEGAHGCFVTEWEGTFGCIQHSFLDIGYGRPCKTPSGWTWRPCPSDAYPIL